MAAKWKLQQIGIAANEYKDQRIVLVMFLNK